MISLSGTYILSQIFVTAGLGLQGLSYFIKNRRHQLTAVIIGNIFTAICFALLSAYVATGMNIIAASRDLTNRYITIHRPGQSANRNRLLLIFWLFIMSVVYWLNADGGAAILPYLSTSIFTIAIWQSNGFIYAAAGLVTNTLMIIYNTHIGNMMGIILHSLLLMCAIFGLRSYIIQNRVNKNRAG